MQWDEDTREPRETPPPKRWSSAIVFILVLIIALLSYVVILLYPKQNCLAPMVHAAMTAPAVNLEGGSKWQIANTMMKLSSPPKMS